MAPSTLRQALGAMKDRASIILIKFSGNMAPELDVAIIKATRHDDESANEKYYREILDQTSHSGAYINRCVSSISKRLGKTGDWIVALKCLMLVHRLLADGDPRFKQEFFHAARGGTRLLNMSNFEGDPRSHSQDHWAFIRVYALYLDQWFEWMALHSKQNYGKEMHRGIMGRSHFYGDHNYRNVYEDRKNRNYKDMKIETLFSRLHHLQQVLDGILSCRPTGFAKSNWLVLIALSQLVRESFLVYYDIREMLAILLDRFFDMEQQQCVKALETYKSCAKQINNLVDFYNWCNDMGLGRSSEYPQVHRITDALLLTLEGITRRDPSFRPKSPEKPRELPQLTPPPLVEIKDLAALPNHVDFKSKTEGPRKPCEMEDLIDLSDDDDDASMRSVSTWEAFPSNSRVLEMTSPWRAPLAEVGGQADWELALVESAGNFSKQDTVASGFSPLLLDAMYDQGPTSQLINTMLPINPREKLMTGMLSWPAQTVAPVAGGLQFDPFAASLSVSPPYVQMVLEVEKKKHFLAQEQVTWQMYGTDGNESQLGFAKVAPAVPLPYMTYGKAPANGFGYGPYHAEDRFH